MRRSALTLLVALVLASCSSGTQTSPSVSSTQGTTPANGATTTTVPTYRVDFLASGPSPADLTVPVGATVVWVNQDTMDHEVHSETNVFEGGMAPGASYQWTFGTAGTYPYHCHPSGEGTITVTG